MSRVSGSSYINCVENPKSVPHVNEVCLTVSIKDDIVIPVMGFEAAAQKSGVHKARSIIFNETISSCKQVIAPSPHLLSHLHSAAHVPPFKATCVGTQCEPCPHPRSPTTGQYLWYEGFLLLDSCMPRPPHSGRLNSEELDKEA